MAALLIKILLLYPAVFPILNFNFFLVVYFIYLLINLFILGLKLTRNFNDKYYTYLNAVIKYKSRLKPFLTKRIKSEVVIYSISNM